LPIDREEARHRSDHDYTAAQREPQEVAPLSDTEQAKQVVDEPHAAMLLLSRMARLSRMTHPLDGARAKIERAGDHLETLDSVLTRFAKEGGFVIAGEPDGDSGEYVMRIYSNRQPPVPPSARTSAIVGDVLNNLRSALNYVIWQLARSPSTKNQFPIFDTPELFEAKRKRYLATVPKEHWAKIESYQPYHGGGRVAFAVLAKLNDADKHRLLLPGAVTSSPRKGKFTVSGLDSIAVKGRDWVPFEDGAEIYRLRLEPHAGSNVNVKAEVPYTIVFADPDSGVGVSVSDLRTLRISVSNVVEEFAGDFLP
jgi:hypothetical protein